MISQMKSGSDRQLPMHKKSMKIMSHAVEGQDLNLINISSNTEEIEYNCDQSINLNPLWEHGWSREIFPGWEI